ncbi:hypothetical protein M438DRAFT_345727 [Aureobasidium pullulans EXF-150]|uniref:Uncharacterized protein n=1 Tax=Aureobasidium pullulans EXF-150 TaxID=1043002 RepID=A0A074XGT1_AURPU|nr:uncharacterized protein M438DRAFT_345727 [Aureobasidium pullulans EXF-150]KEQ84613.1 hypothetical protein M438DRAFT_345727 [Aureobasidium pullulans EXF-150]
MEDCNDERWRIDIFDCVAEQESPRIGADMIDWNLRGKVIFFGLAFVFWKVGSSSDVVMILHVFAHGAMRDDSSRLEVLVITYWRSRKSSCMACESWSSSGDTHRLCTL